MRHRDRIDLKVKAKRKDRQLRTRALRAAEYTQRCFDMWFACVPAAEKWLMLLMGDWPEPAH